MKRTTKKISKSYLIKTKDEIARIRKSCQLSSELHLRALGENLHGFQEVELARKLNSARREMGLSKWAYPLIIGSGSRSTILHAKPTRRRMKNQELVLIDMGVHHQGFAADITRTWPTQLKFTKEQKTIYNIVLRAQLNVIKAVKPRTSLWELHQLCQQELRAGLLSAGVDAPRALGALFPHKTSHWIGKHVHEPCSYFYDNGEPIKLSPGMVFTIEPGLYFRERRSQFQGIGVRIEDVVAVTDSGCEVLSTAPKHISELEDLRAQAQARSSS